MLAGVADQAEQLLNSLIFGGGGAQIKSIQSGVTSLSGTTADVSITAVDSSRSFVVFNMIYDTSAAMTLGSFRFTAKLSSSTTLHFERGTTGGSWSIAWFVIEFGSGVNVQQVESAIPVGSLTTNVTISPVDITRTFLISADRVDGGSANTDNYITQYMVQATLTDASTLNLKRKVSTSQVSTAVVFVVEVKA